MNEIDSINQEINQIQTIQTNGISTINGILADINNLEQDAVNSTPNSVYIEPSQINTQNPTTGITNYFNTGAYITMSGQNTAIVRINNRGILVNKKICIDCYGTPPNNAHSSLFEVEYLCWSNTNFYRTYYKIQIYPNRLWNNTTYSDLWQPVNNHIANLGTGYNVTGTYAPNGRWFWSYDQFANNMNSYENSYIIPYQNKVDLLFCIPNTTDTFTWEIAVRCIDNKSMTDNNSSWHFRIADITPWNN